ncbi:MAG: hypothetical protein F4117_05815 [Acidimicrobiales bacterium]|nr:hypothetical protein [Acidimicrobiales bacterium]MXX43186.1 hypothetical protein [Acidimicrobiales bacterium]MYB82786.1 hypothetical protein [Acidimicrobiales bacterium]MYD34131.1 hypothetical protein [Acidimicrobiales bacterium]MYI08091.1 hypothetical protein [Acidimicrobiales bacterium]
MPSSPAAAMNRSTARARRSCPLTGRKIASREEPSSCWASRSGGMPVVGCSPRCAFAFFDLRGWRLIADAVDALGGGDSAPDGPKARILIGIAEAPRHEMRRVAAGRAPPRIDNQTAARLRDDAVADWRAQLEVGVPTAADEAALRQLRRQIASGAVELRLHTAHRLHAKLYLCHRSDTAAPRVGYLRSSNLTAAGLRSQGELNTDVLDAQGLRRPRSAARAVHRTRPRPGPAPGTGHRRAPGGGRRL